MLQITPERDIWRERPVIREADNVTGLTGARPAAEADGP